MWSLWVDFVERGFIRLMLQAAVKGHFMVFLMMQCNPPASQGNLFVMGFDLPQQTAGLGRLSQMTTKFVSVLSLRRISLLLFSLPALGLFVRIEVQTGTEVTLARPLFVTSVWLDTHIKPHLYFGGFFFFDHMLVMECVVSRLYKKIYSCCLVAS